MSDSISKKDKKLHTIYAKKFKDKELNITKGFQLNSAEYQIRLAKHSLNKIQEEIEKKDRRITVIIDKCLISHFGKLTKEELIKKYKK